MSSDDDFENEDYEEEQSGKKQTKRSAGSPSAKRKLEKEVIKPVIQLPYTDRPFILYQPNDWLNDKVESIEYEIISLTHPKTKRLTRFIYQKSSDTLLEINKYQDPFSSWFINNSVRTDGSLYITSPFDRLFLIIPYLEKLKGKEGDFFGEIGSVKNDEVFSSLSKIEFPHSQLSLICETKEFGGSQLYRMDDKRLLAWLKLKVKSILKYIEEKNLNAYQTSSSIQRTMTQEIKLVNAIDFIGEYISDSLIESLKTTFGLNEQEKQRSILQEQVLYKKNLTYNDTQTSESKPTAKIAKTKAKTILSKPIQGQAKISSFLI